MRLERRVFLTALMTASLLPSQTKQPPPTTEPKIVFVCEHGAAKSIIAAAEFNRLAEQKKLPHRAISRGTNPDPEFAPAVVANLKKDGLPAPSGKPQLISAADVRKAEQVVTLGCKLPQTVGAAGKSVDWNDISSPSDNYAAAKEDIARHVGKLIQELEAKSPAK